MASVRRRSNVAATPDSAQDRRHSATFGAEPGPALVGRGLLEYSPLFKPLAGDAASPFHLRVLHPLTSMERQAVARCIQHEVAERTVEMLRAEQEAEANLHSTHINCISLLVLAVVGLGACMVYLRAMLVPFVLALFFMFLLEPILFFVANIFTCLSSIRTRCGKACFRHSDGAQQQGSGVAVADDPRVRLGDQEDCDGCSGGGRRLLGTCLQKSWNVCAVLASIIVLIGAGAGVVYFSVEAISAFPWWKYADSWKLRLILKLFPHFGTDPYKLKVERVIPWLLQGPLFNALDLTMTIISQSFLMLLFLAFLLASDVAIGEKEDLLGVGRKIRESVRRYIRIKTLMAIAVALLSGTVYWVCQVDLAFLFALLTFILYYIPHVGNTIAIIAPLPLVFLDPSKTLGDLLVVFGVPFLIHHLATNLVDPKLLASSLDLHPIIVLLSLAFWTTVWGPIGAILSVPLTAVVRLLLHEMDHPYTRPVVKLLEGRVRELTGNSRVAGPRRRDVEHGGSKRGPAGGGGARAEPALPASASDPGLRDLSVPDSRGDASPPLEVGPPQRDPAGAAQPEPCLGDDCIWDDGASAYSL